MAKVYYVGDWAVMLGPCFAETPFNYAKKGEVSRFCAVHRG